MFRLLSLATCGCVPVVTSKSNSLAVFYKRSAWKDGHTDIPVERKILSLVSACSKLKLVT